MMIRSGIFLSILLVSPVSNALPQYELIDLGTLNENFSYARAINELGQVTGSFGDLNQSRPFNPATMFTGNKNAIQPVTALATFYDSEGRDVNNNGEHLGAVAFNKDEDYRSFIYSNNSIHYLPPSIDARSINDSGQLTGAIATPETNMAFILEGETLVELESADSKGSFGSAINQNGQIAATIYGSSIYGPRRAAYGDLTGLTVIPGLSPDDSSEAMDINNQGFLTGHVISEGTTRTFLATKDGLVVPDIGTLVGGTYGRALNDDNYIVGTSDDLGTSAAILWTPETGLLRLDDLVRDMSGWYTLGIASDINNAGQIVGVGVRDDYEFHGFFLDPIPQTSVEGTSSGLLLLTGLGLLILVRSGIPRSIPSKHVV